MGERDDLARLYLFGAPRIERNGEAVDVDTRKATALLAYLAMEGGAHARDALVGLLWPEYGQKRARAALRRTLSALHAARDEGWLLVERETVTLGDVWVDVRGFRALLGEARGHEHPEDEVCAACLSLLSRAVDLYRGDFMAGFGLRDSFVFDDWHYFQSESLRRELAGALDRLARGHGVRGEWEPAVAHARRRLTLDPLHEPAHRNLMHLYALSGQRSAAMKQYRECVRILGKELGVAPLDETTRLYRGIGEGAVPPLETREAPASPAAAPAPVHPRGESPLVGRDREWKELHAAVLSGGALVVVEGEAGVGKTRLVEEFLASLAGDGTPVVSVRCYAGETNLAYGPFADVLGRVAESEALGGRLVGVSPPSLAEAARLAPAILDRYPELPAAPPLDTSGAGGRFVEGVARTLFAALETSEGVPGMMFLDDLQWADDASVDLLSYLTRRLSGRGVCVICAWRDEEVPTGHPLRSMLREAQRAGMATVVRPGRLGRPEVVELVRASVGGDEELGERMLQETEGLPLFLAEYLGAVARGEMGVAEGDWSLPGGARDLLEARLDGLSETGRQVLAAAAAIGRSFDFDAAREASGRGEEETVEALEEFTSAGLVTETAGEEGPVYDFSHEKLRALVYEKTSLARRRLLHRRVASFLAGRARGPEVGREAARISYHYHLAGGEAEAAGYARLAGDHARRLYANRDALAHYEQALALGHPEPAALHEAMGDLRTLLGEYAAALESYEAAAALDAYGEGMPAAIEHKLGNVYARQGDWELAAIHYDSALEGHEREEANAADGELARLHADRSLLAHNRGDAEEAERSAQAALALAAEAGDERALAQAHNVLGVLGGRDAISHLEKSLRLAERLEDPDARVAALNNLSLARAASGDLESALELTGIALELCVASGDRHREAALRSNLADLLHAAGREEESMQQVRRSVEIFAEVGGSKGLQPEIWKLVEW